MFPIENADYVPALRFKKGEGGALLELDRPLKDRIVPHIVVPPLSERDIELNRQLTRAEFAPVQVERLLKYWDSRSCFLDMRCVKFALGDAADATHLKKFLDAAVKKGCSTIPVFDLQTGEKRIAAIRDHWREVGGGLAFRLLWSDLVRPQLAQRVNDRLLRLVLKPDQCVLILDLSDAEISSDDDFAQAVLNAIARLQELGLWRRIVVESTSFPERNPASPNSQRMVPRKEWALWMKLVGADSKLKEFVTYGDFGADNAKMNFKGGGQPIVHLRYAAQDIWLVVRGGVPSDLGDGLIHQVASVICESRAFAGEDFSAGDELIADWAARRIPQGMPSDWRKANMNHHMTRISMDLARLLSKPIETRQARRRVIQQDLFTI